MAPTGRRAIAYATAGLALAAAQAASCGGSTTSPFGSRDGGGPGGDDARQGDNDGSSGGPDSHLQLGTDSGDAGGGKMVDSGPPSGPAAVYAESPGVLYKLDPTTNAITMVAPFSGDCVARNDCKDVIDIALDEESNGYATTFGAVYSFDVTTAVMKFIAAGSYPNSLSFVPKGTLDPTAEALVGYNGSTYIRIDTTTGAITTIGGLTDGLVSSGDIVSVIGGGTFLTVNGRETGTGTICSDCLLQIDPSTGDVIQNYGSVNHQSVYGVAFWGGIVYGFDNTGVVFSMTFPGGVLTTTDIAIPGGGPGQFYGAGSTTSAPPKQADGGGIPIK
jgi:hypothetical protein